MGHGGWSANAKGDVDVNIEKMRPCIRKIFEQGLKKCLLGKKYYKKEQSDMTHRIIYELNRLGFNRAQI